MSVRKNRKYIQRRDNEWKHPDGRIFTSSTASTFVETYSGSDVSNYRKLIANRQNASSFYSAVWFDNVDNPLSYCTGKRLWDGRLVDIWSKDRFTLVDPLAYVDFSFESSLDSKALSLIKSKIRDSSAMVKTIAPLAEMSELSRTIRTVTGFTSDFVEVLLDIKKGRWRNAAKIASNQYLNFQFGVKPLIGDIASAAKAVDKRINSDNIEVIPVFGFAEGSRSYRYSNSTTAGDVGIWNLIQQSYVTSRIKYKGAIKVDWSAGNDYSIADQFGLNFGGIVHAAWELVPYSWIVDYFTNVGQYLEDEFTSPGGNLIYLTKSVRRTSSSVMVPTLKANTFVSSARSTPTATHLNSGYYVRTSLASLPHTGLRFKFADEVGRNGITKLLNLTSLLLQR